MALGHLLPTLLVAIALVVQIASARQAMPAFAAAGLAFADRLPFGGARDQSYAVAAGDMDGDGDLDLVVGKSNQSAQPSAVYLNDGSGNFPFGAGLTCNTPRVRCFGVDGGWV